MWWDRVRLSVLDLQAEYTQVSPRCLKSPHPQPVVHPAMSAEKLWIFPLGWNRILFFPSYLPRGAVRLQRLAFDHLHFVSFREGKTCPFSISGIRVFDLFRLSHPTDGPDFWSFFSAYLQFLLRRRCQRVTPAGACSTEKPAQAGLCQP